MNFKRSICVVLIAGVLLGLASLPAAADWKKDWDQTVAAAKKEGAITISIPSGSVWRSEIARFQEAYPDIKLSMTAFSGRDFWARFVKERDVGQYLWDMRIGGYDAQEYQIKQAGNMQSVRDLLILPEVTDDKVWYGGLSDCFMDAEEKYIFGFVAVDQTSVNYNTKFVGPKFDVDDLVDPKWAGKMSMADPRGGSPLTTMGALYKQKGPEFIRKLVVDQKPVITNIPRQQTDWLVSGRYPVAFGVPSAALVEFRKNGGDVSMIAKMTGTRQWSIGVGGITVPTKNPHPNATKVFVNWILSKDVQAHMMKGVELNSRRKDVPQGLPSASLDYDHIQDYVGGQTEDMKPYIEKAQALLRDIVQK